jgi:hypothetical protein
MAISYPRRKPRFKALGHCASLVQVLKIIHINRNLDGPLNDPRYDITVIGAEGSA